MRVRELAMLNPRYGYRRLTILLQREGWQVNSKWFERLDEARWALQDGCRDYNEVRPHSSEGYASFGVCGADPELARRYLHKIEKKGARLDHTKARLRNCANQL